MMRGRVNPIFNLESQSDSHKLCQDSDLAESDDECKSNQSRDLLKHRKARKMKPKKEGKLSRMVSWFEKKVCACTPAERPKLVRKTKPKKVREELASYQDFNKAQMAATEGQ